MANAQVVLAVTLTEINCGKCGGVYAITERYREQKAQAGGYWHCPYCDTSWGFGESENDRLKKEVEAERRRKDEALSRANEANAERDRALRKLKRVGRGVCPECNRTFENLARHMNCKHAAKAA
jgi:uncharacterized Zn finger protein (UPF0148 family)